MRQLTYTGRSSVEWRDVPAPTLESSSEAIVRPLAVARCDLDALMVRSDIFPGPFAVGHECVAEVVEVGDEVGEIRPGDRVLVPFQVSCGNCAPCRSGRFAACETHRAPAGAMFGFGAAGGGHGGAVSDLLKVPAAHHLLQPAPTDVSAVALSTLPDNVVDGYRCVRALSTDHPGGDVLVIGGELRSIGLYAVGWARSLGASSIRYCDTDASRCALAESMGAECTLVEGAWPRRFASASLTVDASGTYEALLTALRSTAPYGYCTIASLYFDGLAQLPQLEMYTRGITVHTSRADSRAYLPEVAALVGSGMFRPLDVKPTVVAWDEAAAVWLEPATKLIVTRVPV